MAEALQILTSNDLERFQKWIRKLPPSDLETLSKLLWKARNRQYEEWDRSIASYPIKKKRR